ncbi:MAG: PilZ domain-containing protein [Rhodocyclaceae bacterium]|nr:PilZ domain-containing protein [Rhodocyclaceae bacterium]
MNTGTDRRRFWRAAFEAPASLASEGLFVEAEVADLSLKGALVEVPANWRVSRGQSVQLDLPLSGDVRILMQTRVAHVDGVRVGLRCEHIDLDSMTHLRRLVELNAGDPALLERELAALAA